MVSIIIVNYNTKAFLLACISSIKNRCSIGSYEIVVVDNASVDGSADELERAHPDVLLIRSRHNLGFGGANNLGAQSARGDYLLFLNSDTVFLNDVVSEFVQAYSSITQKNIGAIGPQLLDEKMSFTHSYGFFPKMKSEAFARLRIAQLPKEKNYRIEAPLSVDYVTGAALFISASRFKEIGGFDKSFFMYYEDCELQLRLRQAGYVNLVVPGPSIVHYVGRSISRSNVRRSFTAVSKIVYYRLSSSLCVATLYRIFFSVFECGLCVIDIFRSRPNYSAREHARFMLCVLTGNHRFAKGTSRA